MKQSFKPKFKPAQILLLSFLIAVSTISDAQSIISAGNTSSSYLDVHNFSYPCSTDVSVRSASTINCDMSTTNTGEKFFVVAYSIEDDGMKTVNSGCFNYSNTPTPLSGLHVEYLTSTPSLQLGGNNKDLPISGTNPDVAIFPEPPGSTNSTSMAVVYESGNDIFIGHCRAGVGSFASPAWFSPLSVLAQLNTPGRIAKSPRIEAMINDTWTGGYKFVATWTEHDLNSNRDYIMVTTGELFSAGTWVTKQITPNLPGDPEGISPDVAAMGVLNPCGTCAPYKTYLTYKDPANGNALMLTELDIDASYSATVTGNTILENGFADIGNPRIDAKTIGNAVSGDATWEVVASVQPTPSGSFEIHSFNDVVTAPTVLRLSPVDDHFSPAVAGVGEDVNPAKTPTGVGETEFSLAYYSTYTNNGTNNNGDIFANAVDISGGTAGINYYEVNDVDLYQNSQYSAAGDIPVAISNSCNDGDDLLTVWFQGYYTSLAWGEIHYKLSGNNYSFRAAGTFNVVKDNISTYPNPAKDVLNIEGANVTDYTIADMTGRILDRGKIDGRNYSLDISKLSPGLYFLSLRKKDTFDKIKFVKQ